jgi:hypothetical protein
MVGIVDDIKETRSPTYSDSSDEASQHHFPMHFECSLFLFHRQVAYGISDGPAMSDWIVVKNSLLVVFYTALCARKE